MKLYHWILLPLAVALMWVFRDANPVQGAEDELCSAKSYEVIALTRSHQKNMFRVLLKEKNLNPSVEFLFYSNHQSEQITMSWSDQRSSPFEIALLDKEGRVLDKKWLLPGQQCKSFEFSSYPVACYTLLVKNDQAADSFLIEKK